MNKWKNKVALYWILLIVGVVIACIGGFLLRETEPKALSGVFIGIGAGLLGLSVGELINIKVVNRYPDYKRMIDIENKDERNIKIKNLAKAKAFDFMIKVFGILMLVYALMNEKLVTILMLVGVYLSVVTVYVVFFNKYSREM
ncbi:hypothetical protein [Sporosalibacterium faouarense]|uniref:hypothetical protein n=1 Tax=Sporosalibacterium faouarense TaxID=516123 RepID=UPI00141CD8A5|nr:hypothetical protein [Sporosalibacterium faouarense]MTI46405.1 hypothetical protein [Bacillota bacterium]